MVLKSELATPVATPIVAGTNSHNPLEQHRSILQFWSRDWFEMGIRILSGRCLQGCVASGGLGELSPAFYSFSAQLPFPDPWAHPLWKQPACPSGLGSIPMFPSLPWLPVSLCLSRRSLLEGHLCGSHSDLTKHPLEGTVGSLEHKAIKVYDKDAGIS